MQGFGFARDCAAQVVFIQVSAYFRLLYVRFADLCERNCA